MPVITSVSGMQSWADARRAQGRRLGLVPTMGALHAGHLALVHEAVDRADDVVVSNFVNPTQFGPNEDYDRYPRDRDQDVRLLKEIDPGIVTFAPTVGEMYPDGVEASRTWIEVEDLDRHLCGRFREGHFRGVSSVVMKLLHACKPDVAVFGLKDAQQFVIIQRMVRDMLLDVDVVGVPIVREDDGLAYSSRNAYLTPEQRASARRLSKAVHEAERRILMGEQQSGPLVESMRSELGRGEDLQVQYVEVVDAATLEPVDGIAAGQRILAAVAAYVGSTRLIDNVFVQAPEDGR